MLNDTPTTEHSPLTLHDALPIYERSGSLFSYVDLEARVPKGHPLRTIREIVNRALSDLSAADGPSAPAPPDRDRKSTRLNSSHSQISYAVFCLKKKNRKEEYVIS